MHTHASLNHTYRLVWSEAQQGWVAVAETSRGKGKAGKSTRLAAAVLAMAALSPLAHAAPEGGQVTAGSGSITQSGSTTTITQSSQNLSLTWQSFNVGAQERVNFVQPGASAIAVNRILDTNGSQILGALNANGQVYLINPNGILFGAGAQVNVGGLVASTLDLSDASLASNTRSFAGSGTGSILNQGSLNASQGGYIALLGNTVSNQGSITANGGTVALGAGSAVTLTFADNSLLKLQVDSSTLNNLADNGGLIQANGGVVLLSAGAKDSVLASVVNNTGVIEAHTVDQRNGTIILLGGMTAGTTTVAGTLDASAPNGGNGGFIETSAAHVKVADGTRVTTAAPQGGSGTWLIDPVDYTIAASGGDMTGATLGANLATNNITIQSSSGASGTAGDINVNDTVSWSANKLTLNAQNNININANLNGSGTASLALEYGQANVAAGNTSTYKVNAAISLPAGNSFSTKLGSDGAVVNYTVITSLGSAGSTTGTDLQGMSGNLAGNYALGVDIDASATSGWNAGAGFAPVGNSATNFSGRFEGLGHTISRLKIQRPSTDYVGLFGYANGATIANVGLPDGYVLGNLGVGSLAGVAVNTSISKTYTTGTAVGTIYVGGLVGAAQNSVVSNSYASGSVGGINPGMSVGGLVGYSVSSTVSNSYATGSIQGGARVGGLVGQSDSGIITNSYSMVNVTGSDYVGGLVGYCDGQSRIINSYAAGMVAATSPGDVGALVGFLSVVSDISNSYWDSFTLGLSSVGQNSSVGASVVATAVTSDPAQSGAANYAFKQTAYAGLDFSNNWYMVSNYTRPFLRSEYSTTIRNAHQLQLMAMNLGASYTLATNIDAGETGAAASGPAGMWLGTGFVPVGDVSTTFTGRFDGLGHTVSNLTINRQSNNAMALFGFTSGATISNVGLLGGSVTGNSFVGSLVGYGWNSTIRNSYATGSVRGSNDQVGGLVGLSYGNSTISNSYATGSVSGGGRVGGLVGENYNSSISNSYATGSVSGGGRAGGLVGANYTNGSVSNSYATGSISGTNYVGGLVGQNYNSSVSNSYATGSVTGTVGVGGLVGVNLNNSITSNSYWNTSTSGQATSAGGTGLSSTQMMQLSSFSGWDIASTGGSTAVWRIYEGQTAPLLRSFLTALTLADTSVTYNGATQSGASTPTTGLLVAASGRNVGSYIAYSNQQGYDISGGNLSITPATVTISGITAGDKTYNATTTATLYGTASVSVLGADVVSLTGTGAAAFADKNAGTGKTVTVSGYTLVGADAANYSLVSPNLTANIIRKAITISGITAGDKTYDGTTAATVNTAGATGWIVGDSVSLNTTGSFADKNVGAGKTVALSSSYSGADASNYVITDQAGTTASITPATLNYVANPLSLSSGQTPTGLGGTVTGFVGGDTQASVISGTLGWSTLATAASLPGQYAINGGGLTAANYVLAQAAGNASALTILPGTPSQSVINQMTLLQSRNNASVPGVGGTLLVQQQGGTTISGASGATGVDTSAGGLGGNVGGAGSEQGNLRLPAPGGEGNPTALQVVSLGIRLPDNTVLVGD